MKDWDISSRAFEQAALEASEQAIAESKALGLPVFSYDEDLEVFIMETPQGRRFVVELFEDGTHKIVHELVEYAA